MFLDSQHVQIDVSRRPSRAEPKCAVRSAVEQGVIAEERYLNYLDLYENFDADNQYR